MNLISWAKRHHWDSLEKDKYLIIRHLLTFSKDDDVETDLYEACKSAYAWYYRGCSGDYRLIGEVLKQALAKAEVNK